MHSNLFRIMFALAFIAASPAHAAFESGPYLSLEGGSTWQSRNDVRIPGNSGTLVDLTAWGKGPVFAGRVYTGYRFSPQHELRALWAPLSLTVRGQATSPISFAGQTFAANVGTEAFYKFNSYRLGYTYHFEDVGPWVFSLGFTAKIRDAEVRLTQNAIVGTKKNVGFVPLLNARAYRMLSESCALSVDLDGMGAPQGRAFDLAVTLEKKLLQFGDSHQLTAYAGYRTVEGGADNDEVYSFAWINSAVLGARVSF